MLLDGPNPYRPKLPDVLHLDYQDYEFKLSDGNDRAMGQEAPWLVVAYMAANCNLAEYLFDNLLEMKAVGSGDKMHVCVLFAGPLITDSFFARLNRDSRLSEDILFRFSSVHSSDPKTLTMALRLARRYPAQRRLVFLCGHGLGWKGALQDQSLGRAYVNDPRRLVEPAGCFARLRACQTRAQDYLNSDAKLAQEAPPADVDLLALDACYMGNLEVVAGLASEARMLIVSEGRAPGQGFPYGRILAELQSHPAMPTEDVAHLIIQANQAVYGAGRLPLTQRVVVTAKIEEMVSALVTLAQRLDTNDDAIFAAVRAGMENSAALGGTGNIDLKGFVEELLSHSLPAAVREAGHALLGKLAALAARSSDAVTGSGSLSIYGPPPEDFDPAYLKISGKLPAGLPIWIWFLAGYYLRLLGDKAPGHPLIKAIQETMEDMIRRGLYRVPPVKTDGCMTESAATEPAA